MEDKSKLFDLETDYPKSSNLIFLEAFLGNRAGHSMLLSEIHDQYPKNNYARHSLSRSTHTTCLGFLSDTTNRSLQQLKDCPNHPYLK